MIRSPSGVRNHVYAHSAIGGSCVVFLNLLTGDHDRASAIPLQHVFLTSFVKEMCGQNFGQVCLSLVKVLTFDMMPILLYLWDVMFGRGL
jgi:hypothetical protein